MKSIAIKFHSDLDRIASDLIKSYGLGFSEEMESLSDPLMRWMDFRLRYIEPKPRKIVLSNRFPMKLSEPIENGLHTLEQAILAGEDINSYQSKTLIRFSDMSGNKRAKRTDLMWADWGIHHLHITDIDQREGDYFSARACSSGESALIFCLVTEDAIGFIDIRAHDDKNLFSDATLMEIAIESWPEYFKSRLLPNVMASREKYTNEEVAGLRKAGIATLFCVGDKTYATGGVTSASTSTSVSMKSNEIVRWIRNLADLVDSKEGQFQSTVKSFGIVQPEFGLCLCPEGLAVFEGKSNIAFTFARFSKDANAKRFNDTARLMFPDWALKHLQDSLSKIEHNN